MQRYDGGPATVGGRVAKEEFALATPQAQNRIKSSRHAGFFLRPQNAMFPKGLGAGLILLCIGVEWVLVINQELNMFDITHALKKIGGGTLLDCGGYQPRDESSYASALVLVRRRVSVADTPFVVWTAVNGEPDMRAYFVSGHYFDNEKEARDYLQERTRIEFVGRPPWEDHGLEASIYVGGLEANINEAQEHVEQEEGVEDYFMSAYRPLSEKPRELTAKDDIHLRRLLTLLAALKLEVKGMKRRGKTVNQIIKDEFGLKGNRQRVLDQFEAHVNELREQRGLPTN